MKYGLELTIAVAAALTLGAFIGAKPGGLAPVHPVCTHTVAHYMHGGSFNRQYLAKEAECTFQTSKPY